VSAPPLDHVRVDVDANGAFSGGLVPEDGSSTKVRFDIGSVCGKDIDYLVKTLAFPSGILHAQNHRQNRR